MGKKWYSWLVAGVLALGLAAIMPQKVSAAQRAVPLRVQPVMNKYQVTQAKSYYDIEMKPGQKTELTLKLGNVSTKPLKVKVQVAAAQTNTIAQIDYSGLNTTYDSSMLHPLPSLIGVPESLKTITIPANKTAIYHFPLTMPKQSFKGYVLGQINIKEADVKQTKGKVNNTYSYGVGVKLSNGTSVQPTLTNPGKVQIGRVNAQTAVLATLQNPKASAIRNGTLSANVTKRGQNRVLKSVEYSSSSVAPNSRFQLSVPWTGNVAPGDYTLHIVYKSTDPSFDATQYWRFTRNFHVSTVQAARYTLASYHIPWWVYLIAAIIILLLLFIIWLLLKRRKEERASDDQS